MNEQEHNGKNECCEHHHGHSGRKKCRDISGDDWWSERGIAEKVLIGIGLGILGIAFVSFIGWVTMRLWNALMPDIFGFGRIGYWQAWGLLLLSCIFSRILVIPVKAADGKRSAKRPLKTVCGKNLRWMGLLLPILWRNPNRMGVNRIAIL